MPATRKRVTGEVTDKDDVWLTRFRGERLGFVAPPFALRLHCGREPDDALAIGKGRVTNARARAR
jgi:hypothetical protein